VHGADWNAADARARDMMRADPEGCGYVHPFAHPALHRGHSTVITECHRQGATPDAVVTVVGGGVWGAISVLLVPVVC